MVSQRTVLIVDDEEDLRGVIASEFMFREWNTVEAQNGQEALKMLDTHEIDAIVSDVRMPDGDGVFLCQELNKRAGIKPIVILISGYSDVTPDRAKDIGAFEILQKPFKITELFSVIDTATKK